MDSNSDMDLVGRAIALSRSSASVSGDLNALLFPKSDVAMSDRLLSNSRQYLHKIVGDIESEICRIATERNSAQSEILERIAESEQPQSYGLLKQARIFDNEAMLNHVFAQAQRRELHARLLHKTSQDDLEGALTRNLDHPDAAIAEAAMALLIAQNKIGVSGSAHIAELPAEILYDLVWPIVAGLEKISGVNGAVLVDAAERLFVGHDESQSVQARAIRLASLLEQDGSPNADYPHPLKDGLELSLARLANRTGLIVEQLILFSAETNMARLVLAMRALNLPTDDALSIFAALDGSNGLLTKASYNEVAIDEAQKLVETWSMNAAYRDAVQKIASITADDR